jgi:hypothetical protein
MLPIQDIMRQTKANVVGLGTNLVRVLNEAIRHSPLIGIALIIGAVSNMAVGITIATIIGLLFALFGPASGIPSVKRLEVNSSVEAAAKKLRTRNPSQAP